MRKAENNHDPAETHNRLLKNSLLSVRSDLESEALRSYENELVVTVKMAVATVGQAFLLVFGFMKKCMHEKNSRDKQECLSYHLFTKGFTRKQR